MLQVAFKPTFVDLLKLGVNELPRNDYTDRKASPIWIRKTLIDSPKRVKSQQLQHIQICVLPPYHSDANHSLRLVRFHGPIHWKR